MRTEALKVGTRLLSSLKKILCALSKAVIYRVEAWGGRKLVTTGTKVGNIFVHRFFVNTKSYVANSSRNVVSRQKKILFISEEEMAKVLLSERGREKLIFNGFAYTKHRDSADGIRWKCEKNGCLLKCNAYALTAKGFIDGGEVKEFGQHVHGSSAAKYGVIEAKNSLKRKAGESVASTSFIVSDVIRQTSDFSAANLPKVKSMKRNVQNYRSSDLGPTPSVVEDFVVPDRFRKTLDGEEYLMLDEIVEGDGDGGRIIVFYTMDGLEILKASAFWMVDGTFGVASKIFSQLYTVHALVAGVNIPVVFALMTKKKKGSYVRLFEHLRDRLKGDEFLYAPPDVVLTDFEQGAISAISEVFNADGPATTVHGCFFHLRQSIQRKIDDKSCKSLYASNAEFATYTKMIAALSFVKIHCVVDYFLRLRNYLNSRGSDEASAALAIVDYFGRTYVGIDGDVQISAPFPPPLWNNVQLTEVDAPRTNNLIESWHRRFEVQVGTKHPHPFKLLESIQKEEQYMKRYYRQICAGKGSPREKKYDELDARFKHVMSMFETLTFEGYLRGISANL